MFTYDESLTTKVLDYCRERLALDPVPLDLPGRRADLAGALAGLISRSGSDPEVVLRSFEKVLAPAILSADSPRYLAFIPAAPTKAALLFDMVVSCSSLQGISWLEAAGAVAAENAALSVVAQAAGLPPTAGGCFVSGGSAGNLSALAVARGCPLAPSGRQWRVAVSDDAHSSVSKALWLLGMDPLVVPTPEHRLTAGALHAALEADDDPSTIVAVVATAGTTNAGIIDDLAGVAGVAAERGLWFHVDGAYGGAGLLSRQLRPRYVGIEKADSLVVDPHKWLFAPFDCAAVLYREPSKARKVHTQQAGYLDVLHASDPEDWNPSDYAYHLTRRARGLPLWFSLAVHGLDAYEAAIEAAVATAGEAASMISHAEHLELLRDPELSVVLFRRRDWGPSDYHRWSEQLLTSQVAFVTPTTWEGEVVARLAFVHPDTSLDVVRDVLDSMR